MKVLIVVDMQNDFVYGDLSTQEARDIVPRIRSKISSNEYDLIIFTQDSHYYFAYNDSSESELYPIHCVTGETGHDIIIDLNNKGYMHVEKETFGYGDWRNLLSEWLYEIEEIELCGVCTDICVISNALELRSIIRNVVIKVDPTACAGTTVENHEAALRVMQSCAIKVSKV